MFTWIIVLYLEKRDIKIFLRLVVLVLKIQGLLFENAIDPLDLLIFEVIFC